MPGAFILDAPGTYVSEAEGRLVIGNRPGMLHYSIAVGVPAFSLALLWLFPHDAWWLGVGALVLFGLPSVLVLFNSQRYIVTTGHVAMRGRVAAFTVNRDWPLLADSAVRIDTRIERDQDAANLWTCHQVQILTTQGWIPIAESMQRGRALEFGERLARVAGVKILNSSNIGTN
jgi:hypothetical protein